MKIIGSENRIFRLKKFTSFFKENIAEPTEQIIILPKKMVIFQINLKKEYFVTRMSCRGETTLKSHVTSLILYGDLAKDP